MSNTKIFPSSSTIQYVQLTPREHILQKPDLYIGTVKPENKLTWIIQDNKISKLDFIYSNALFKIYDEIISNAQDEYYRYPSRIKSIEIKILNDYISVLNIGTSIPFTQKLNKDNILVYIPTLIFGEFLTSSNYGEKQQATIGTYGIGAKATNVFSTYFQIKTYNSISKQLFSQIWTNNMSNVQPPSILNDVTYAYDFTQILFKPDLLKFNTQSLNSILPLFKKRIYDLAGIINIPIKFNNDNIYCPTFLDYVKFYTDEIPIYDKQIFSINNKTEKIEYAIIINKNKQQQDIISFINGNFTEEGGTHVTYFLNLIIKLIKPIIDKKNKTDIILKPNIIKQYFTLFLNCTLIDTTFNSQSKEKCTSTIINKYELTKSFEKKILNSDLISNIMNHIFQKENKKFIKISEKKTIKLSSIPKLDDAEEAGTKNSYKCTLILTEGDSAKSLAISGLSIIGRKYYGVFPLKGKLLNVREASKKKILNNQEIQNLIQILGLTLEKKYTDVKSLRYGKIMIMADQDQDGSHIKGLIINFIHCFWPSLIELNFIVEFITPIIKVTDSKRNVISFFSILEFKSWVENNPNRNYQIKYYKGLGTSTPKEAKEYFQNLSLHKYDFIYESTHDKDIIQAFSKSCITDRKVWLTEFMTQTQGKSFSDDINLYTRTNSQRQISYKDFFNKEFILFSNMDNIRSIPNIMDGFKPGQRKIMFVLFNRNQKNEIKVEQLSGIVSSESAYHHGEQSLKMTIIKLANNYIGSNNINFLEPLGQFGSRIEGGKDAASPRYIYTKLSPITNFIFIKDDNFILDYIIEENTRIEPYYYIPIFPTILINGATGIGTGWSTLIPTYNPKEIVEELIFILDQFHLTKTVPLSQKKFLPWFQNFKGDIIEIKKICLSVGKIFLNYNTKQVLITELPIKIWTSTFKSKYLLDNNDILKLQDFSDDQHICFLITFTPEHYNEIYNQENGFFKYFKLTSIIQQKNLIAFNHKHVLTHYKNVNEILNEFIEVRLQTYEKRRNYLILQKQKDLCVIKNKVRFIQEICDSILNIQKKKKEEVISILKNSQYDSNPHFPLNIDDYDYLIKMTIDNLTKEKIQTLEKIKSNESAALDLLLNIHSYKIWYNELNNFLIEYKKYLVNNKAIFNLPSVININNFSELKYIQSSTLTLAEIEKHSEIYIDEDI